MWKQRQKIKKSISQLPRPGAGLKSLPNIIITQAYVASSSVNNKKSFIVLAVGT